MNAEKYTQKSLAAVKAAQELTIQNQNQQIEQLSAVSISASSRCSTET